jgi:hypothetical protein
MLEMEFDWALPPGLTLESANVGSNGATSGAAYATC